MLGSVCRNTSADVDSPHALLVLLGDLIEASGSFGISKGVS